jgi:hypothetical protein
VSEEKELGLKKTQFNAYLYSLKRFGFKTGEITHEIMAAIGGPLGISVGDFDHEK